MSDPGYVIGGWTATGTVLAGYTVRVWVRTRRARRLLEAAPAGPPTVEAGYGPPTVEAPPRPEHRSR